MIKLENIDCIVYILLNNLVNPIFLKACRWQFMFYILYIFDVS